MPPLSKFETTRIRVTSLNAVVADPRRLSTVARELVGVLTPAVLQPLPEALQLPDTLNAVQDWVAQRTLDSEVHLVSDRSSAKVLGLLMLAPFNEPERVTTVHVGYLLAESAWGQGYASELIAGLVACYQSHGQTVQLLGGVAAGHRASSKVLQKNGFVLLHQLSTPATNMYGLHIP